MKINSKILEQMVAKLNKHFGYDDYDTKIILDHNVLYGGYVLKTQGGAKFFDRGVSQRISAREMYYYLSGFLFAIDT